MCYVDRGIQNFKTSGILLFTPGTFFFIFFKQFRFLNSIKNRRLKLDTISAIIRQCKMPIQRPNTFVQPNIGLFSPAGTSVLWLLTRFIRGKRKYIQKLLGTLILQVKCTHRNLRLYTFLVLKKYTPSPTLSRNVHIPAKSKNV